MYTSQTHSSRPNGRGNVQGASKSHGKPQVRFWLILAFLSLLSVSSAFTMEAEDVSNETYYKSLAEQGQLVIDTRIYTPPQRDNIVRRQDDGNSTQTVSSTITASPSPTSQQNSTTTASQTASSSSISTSTLPTSTTLPSPFDTSLGNNFTSTSCPTFFQTFLNNATFQSCLPVSLLLQNSLSFFKVARSEMLLDQTLDAACSASLAICSPLMSYFASQLISNTYCGADYQRENPLVLQAYAGLVAYEPMYKATCLQDPATNQYCFAEALTNSSNPSDSYPYYTGIGIALPSSATPSCSPCLQHTMQIFAGYAVQKAQPLASTYLNCALQINKGCGSSFANVEVKPGSSGTSTNDALRVQSGHSILLMSSAILALWQLLT